MLLSKHEPPYNFDTQGDSMLTTIWLHAYFVQRHRHTKKDTLVLFCKSLGHKLEFCLFLCEMYLMSGFLMCYRLHA